MRVFKAIPRRWHLAAVAGLLVSLVGLWLTPVVSGVVRFGTLATIVLLWAAVLPLLWRRPVLRGLVVSLPLVVAVVAVLPARPLDVPELRRAYVRALGSYTGTRYVWGGESPFGIDCSGLVRRGLIDATLSESLRRLDPGLLRASLSLRWHDATARALRDGHRGLVSTYLESPSLREIDRRGLELGDLAVTQDGLHIMAHLGGGEWIEADPGAGKVIRLHEGERSRWLAVPVVILRWNWSAL